MKGKIVFVFVVALILLWNSRYNAQYTFSKNYSAISSSPNSYLLKHTQDGFMIAGINKTGYPASFGEIFLLKIDPYGNKERLIIYHLPQSFRLPYNPFAVAADDNFVYFSTYSENEMQHISMTKLNSELNVEWEKFIQFNSNGLYYQPIKILALENGNFLLTISIKTNDYVVTHPDSILLLRFSADGDLIEEKTIQIEGSYLFHYRVIITPDNKIIINGKNNLCLLDAALNTLWTKYFEHEITAINYGYGNTVFIALQNTMKSCIVILLDQFGNELWRREAPGSITAFTNFSSTGFSYITASNFHIRINSNEGVEFQNQLWGIGQNISEIPGEGYLLTGEFDEKLWVHKTDYNGNLKTIFITSISAPPFGIMPYSNTVINWRSNSIDKIDIAYSTDNGISWKNIITNYPADSVKYTWGVTYLPGDSVIIKLSDSANPLYSDATDNQKTSFSSSNYDIICINEILTWIGNDGISAHDPRNDASGFYWPDGHSVLSDHGNNLTSVFSDGIMMGGLVNGEIRIGGTQYWSNMQPGLIDDNGLPADPGDPKYKIWKIRRDWLSYPEGDEKSRLQYDYENWPGDIGAPFEDINSNNRFDAGLDVPKFLGDEVVFTVNNNFDEQLSLDKYYSLPLGVEVQTTIYGFKQEKFLEDVLFKKIKVINKSPNHIENMVIGYWSDFDLGYAGDDVVGCDTLLSLGFGYNGDEIDEGYYELPPAIGYLYLQGPVIKAEQSDSAYFDFKWRKGYKNLKMDSFAPIVKNYYPFIFDPRVGNMPYEYYNNLRGLGTATGDTLVDPITGAKTRTPLAGDPISKTGWYDGDGWPHGPAPYDRRLILNSGQFNLAPKDTQEVVYAIMMAQADSRINSLAKLKQLAQQVKEFYYTGIITGTEYENQNLPGEFSLSQNFPNPFNPVTTIKFTIPDIETGYIPSLQHVTLKVYDILGREVATLVNVEQKPGTYTVEFDGSKLASGVYFYKLQTGSGFNMTKKLVLLK
ncbi:MAG: T9SS type A sorting domain-containing protein [bacterium]